MADSSLNITRIYGTSSDSQRNFAVSNSIVAYIASGGVVVCHVDKLTGALDGQRFFCATGSSSSMGLNGQGSSHSPTDTVQKDSFGLPKLAHPIVVDDSSNTPLSLSDLNTLSGSPMSKLSSSLASASLLSSTSLLSNATTATTTSSTPPSLSSSASTSSTVTSQRIKTIACIAISPDGRLLAVGETGTQPRILLFSLAPDSTNSPIISIAEHNFGLCALHFSPDSKYLLSIGDPHDGFIYLWKLSLLATSTLIPTAHIIGANKCTSQIHGVLWYDDTIVTYGVRHIKIWKFEEFDKKSMIQGKNATLGDFINGFFVNATQVTHNEGEDDLLFLTSLGEVVGYNHLNNSLTLRYVHSDESTTSGKPKLKVGCILNDAFSTKVWIATDQIKELPLSHLQGTLDKSIDGTIDSPSKIKFIPPIIAMRQLSSKYLVYLTSNEEIQLFDIDSNTSTHLIDSLSKSVQGVKKTSSGKIITWTKEGVLKSIDPETLELKHLHNLQIPEVMGKVIENHITSLDITMDGEIVIGDAYGNLIIYDKDANEKIFMTQAHELTINDVKFFEIGDFKFIVSIGRDRMVQVFAKLSNDSNIELHDEITKNWEIYQTLADHRGNLLQVIQHDNKIYVSSADRSISIHKFNVDSDLNVVSIQREKTISMKSTPTAMTISQSHEELIVSTMDKQVSIYNLNTLELIRNLKLYNESNDSLLADNLIVTSPNHIVCSCSDKSIRLFNYTNGRQIAVNWGHSETIKFLIHASTETLITLSSNGCLFNWSLSSPSALSSRGSTIYKYNELATPPNVMRKIKRVTGSQVSTPIRRSINTQMSPSSVKASPVVTRLQSTIKMTPSKLNSSGKTNLSPSPNNVNNNNNNSGVSTPRTLTSRSSSPRVTNGVRASPSPSVKSKNVLSTSILMNNKTRLQDSITNGHEGNKRNNENKISAEDLVRQLRSFKENIDSYSYEDVQLVKVEMRDVFNYEEELLVKYNSVVLDAVKRLLNVNE